MFGFLKKEWQTVSPNAKWDAVKWAGAAIIAVGYALLQKVRHLPFDWIAVVGLFALSVFVFLYLGRNKKIPTHTNEQTQKKNSDQDTHNLAAYAAALNREVGRLHEKLKEYEAPKTELPLPDRVGAIARELLQFLQEQDPAPKVENRESIRAALKTNWERLPKNHDGYMARFHDRVEKIVHELGAIGERDYDLNNLVNKSTHGDADIESIANKLLSLGSKLAGKEYTSRFQITQSAQSARAVPTLRPKVVPTGFGPQSINDPLFGLWLTNNGEPTAYDITIPDIPLQHSQIQVSADIPSMNKGEKHFCIAMILTFPQQDIGSNVGMRVGGQLLFTKMKELQIDTLDFEILYTDDEKFRYTTKCKLERRVADVAVRLVGLE